MDLKLKLLFGLNDKYKTIDKINRHMKRIH